jgi:hypothetical protein
VEIPGERPATAMVAGLFDPGAAEPRTRPLAGHSIAVYEPDARLSIVWPVPDEDEAERQGGERFLPEWTEQDSHDWKHAHPGWAVILLSESPIWQALLWYFDWGSGVGGYVSDLQPVFDGEDADGKPAIERWETSAWAVGLARLINSFSATGDWDRFDPTPRLVRSPAGLDPTEAQKAR